MQISRLFEIVYLLLGRKKTTAGELAQRFEVSVRTIYRDIDTLCEAGIPIYTTRGTGGGIFLQEDFVLNKSLLSEQEQNQILVALQSLSATGQMEADQLMSRLGNLFRKPDTGWIEVDFTGWGTGEEERETFRKLQEAVTSQQTLRFTYVGQGGAVSHRTVSPLKLTYKSKAWYLHAHCHQKQARRMFKLSRMLEVGEPGEPFDRSALPPAEDISYPMIPLSGTIHLLLRFSPRSGYRIYDEFRHQEIEKQEDGSFLVNTQAFGDDWLYGTLLSYGPDVEVLSPPCVRQGLREMLEQMINFYST